MKETLHLIATYRPNLPADHWLAIRDLVHDIIHRFATGQNLESVRVALITLAGFADWVYTVGAAQLDLDILRADLFDAYEAYRRLEVQPNIAARDRKRLYALAGEPLPAEVGRDYSTTSKVADPYTAAELDVIRDWAQWQPNRIARISANGFVGLGLGCGLRRSEAALIHRKHVHRKGDLFTVDVPGGRARRVPVDPDWADHLAFAADTTSGYLIAPGATTRTSRASRLWFSRARGTAPVPSRMRNTWLLGRINEAESADALVREAGVSSIRSLERFISAHAPHRLPLTHGARSPR